jgi:predicted TIM-barrel fold metal-dependent hydrolase
MVVIDAHTHISKEGCIPNEIIKVIVEDAPRRTGIAPKKITRNLEKHPTVYQASPEILIKDMDEAGIDKSILLTVDYGLAPGLSKPKFSIEEYNKWVADAADQYPDRLIAFAGVDPREGCSGVGYEGIEALPPMRFLSKRQNCNAPMGKGE